MLVTGIDLEQKTGFARSANRRAGAYPEDFAPKMRLFGNSSRSHVRRNQVRLLFFPLVVWMLGATAASPSRADRLHWDKMHVWMDCTTDCDVDWKMWELHRSPDFTVRVSFRDQPLSGVRVTLTSEDPLPDGSGRHVMASHNTDPDGVARFSEIPSGRYIAHVNQGLLAQSQDVEVQDQSTSSGELRLEWPAAPIATRTLSGWISAWQRVTPQNHSRRIPLARVQVQLFDLRSGELLGSVRTSEEGYYEFPAASEGLYVMRFSEGQYPGVQGYDQAVEVASAAVRNQMPGFVVDHVCNSGLSLLNPKSDMQEPCVPTGAGDPMPPIQQPYRIYSGPIVIVQQQVVVLR
jgi:hypothetical protein